MTPVELVLHGNVKVDGTLEIMERPTLPAGPVEIVVRPLPMSQAGSEHWWQYLQRARAELQATGHRFRTKEEIDAEIESLRSGDERIAEAAPQLARDRRPSGQAS